MPLRGQNRIGIRICVVDDADASGQSAPAAAPEQERHASHLNVEYFLDQDSGRGLSFLPPKIKTPSRLVRAVPLPMMASSTFSISLIVWCSTAHSFSASSITSLQLSTDCLFHFFFFIRLLCSHSVVGMLFAMLNRSNRIDKSKREILFYFHFLSGEAGKLMNEHQKK